MSFDLDSIQKAVAEHGVVNRILVADAQGSVPRNPGTSMLVWEAGQSGTIGGGRLEWDAVAQARSMDGASAVVRVPLGPAIGQCCGGRVTLVFEQFRAGHLPEISGPVFVRRVEGGEEMPLSVHRAVNAARNAADKSGFLFDKGWLIEAIAPTKAPLWIFGAGHVGRAIVSVIAPLPTFAVTWVDTDEARFPDTLHGATPLIAKNPADVLRFAPPDAHHLILTYSHAFDLELCHQVLSHSFASAGLIGSRTKWARFRSRLKALGHTDAQIDRIECPIGDPALGKHPQAIAIGVANRLVEAQRSSNKMRQWQSRS
ncbi:MAG: xanthine dehydrogenase accessory protein XdhC [Pseudomonadota bacterium]